MSGIESGMALGSRYRVGELIGRGGMGVVHRGEMQETGQAVAIKFLRPDLASDANVVARFIQERTILLSLSSPHLVSVHDLIVEGDRLAIVMDLVQGSDLRALLNARRTLPPAEASRLAGQVLRGLAVVHSAGIVHRDVKPENILLDTGQSPTLARLTDFGVSRMATGANLTRMTSVIGTPEYMAPELYDSEKATPAADIYSLGVVLYEMLAGRSPYSGGAPVAVMRRQLDFEPPAIDGLDPALWQLLTSMLNKSAEQRGDARSLADELEQSETRLAAAGALPPQGRPRDDEWIPTPGSYAARAQTETGERLRDTQMSTAGAAAGEVSRPLETVVTSRRQTLPEATAEGPLAANVLEEPGIPAPEPHSTRRQRSRLHLLGSVAVVLVLLLVLGRGFLPGGKTSVGTSTASWAFAPISRADGVLVARQWELSGADGSQLVQRVTLSNPKPSKVTVVFDDVIPKEVAPDISVLTFVPSPTSIINKDPVVRFKVSIAPKASVRLSATVTLPSGKVSVQRLENLATKQVQAERAYLKAIPGAGKTQAVTTLASLRASDAKLSLVVGFSKKILVSGSMSDGKPAPATLLEGLGWSSSNPGAVTVSEGRVIARAVGQAKITVQAGSVKDIVTVTVAARPASGPKISPPGAPRAVSATGGDQSAKVSWTAPSKDGGSKITSYIVTAKPGSAHCDTRGTLSCSVSGLTNGTAYTFQVQAENGAGLGSFGTSSAVIPSGLPSAPWNVRSTAASLTAVRVNWNDPGANGSAIDVITVSNQQTGRTCTAGPGVGTCVIDGLNPGTDYTFVLKAHNANGDSAWSAAVGGSTAAAPPGVPSNLRPTDNSQTAVRLNWNDPPSNGRAIDVITVSNQQTGRTCTAGPGVGTCVIDGLNPGTSYTFVVKAHNAMGDSAWSGAVGGSTQARPRVVSVGQGSEYTASWCYRCRRVIVSVSGFAPNSSFGVELWTNNGGTGVWARSTITTDGAGNYSGNPGGFVFGFWGQGVWARVDGVESAHDSWPRPW